MDLLSLIQSGLTLIFLLMIFDSLSASIDELLHSQQIFGGKLLFFLYSLLVYYRGFRLNILFWDFFLNTPIYNAYSLINYFTTTVIGISIAPPDGIQYFFTFLIPILFIYKFVQYWTSYLFMDKRIGKLAGILGVMLFSASGTVGWISAVSVPLGFPMFGSGLLLALVNSLPFTESSTLTVWVVLIGSIIMPIIIFWIARSGLTDMVAELDDSKWLSLAFIVLVFSSIGIVAGSAIAWGQVPLIPPITFVALLLSMLAAAKKKISSFIPVLLVWGLLTGVPLLTGMFGVTDPAVKIFAFVFLLVGLAILAEVVMAIVLVMIQYLLKRATGVAE